MKYKPIACEIYDELEVLAMRKSECVVKFIGDDNALVTMTSRILDVYARSGEEFIDLQKAKTIRLDRLVSINGKPIGGSCRID